MTEETLQKMVVKYLKVQYKGILFNSDMSGVRLPKALATRTSKLRSNKGFPDIAIFKPKTVNGKFYSGLFLELKKDGVRVFKKDGSLVPNEHIREQYETITLLNNAGYLAAFAIGFDDAKELIDMYLKN